jgi:RNA polymerase sigma factor (sigma-70 family)
MLFGFGPELCSGCPGIRNHCQPDEVELVRRVCANDPEAVSAFYCDYLIPIAKTVVRSFHASGVAPEELANNHFIRLCENNWRRLRTWEGRNLPGWLRRGCSRLLLEILKDSSRVTPLMEQHESRLVQDDEALHRLLRDETGFLLLDAIELLDIPRDRDVIRMYYLESKDLPAIAAEIGVLVGTLYVVKARALARLRSILEGKATNAGASQS